MIHRGTPMASITPQYSTYRTMLRQLVKNWNRIPQLGGGHQQFHPPVIVPRWLLPLQLRGAAVVMNA